MVVVFHRWLTWCSSTWRCCRHSDHSKGTVAHTHNYPKQHNRDVQIAVCLPFFLVIYIQLDVNCTVLDNLSCVFACYLYVIYLLLSPGGKKVIFWSFCSCIQSIRRDSEDWDERVSLSRASKDPSIHVLLYNVQINLVFSPLRTISSLSDWPDRVRRGCLWEHAAVP